MSKVLFIGVTRSQQSTMMRKVCMVVDRAFQEGKKTLLITGNRNHAARLDDLLWTFDEASFIPHSVLDAHSSPLDSAVITSTGMERLSADIYMNFTREPVPADLIRDSERTVVVYEFVRGDQPESRAAGRHKWTTYKELGIAAEKREL